MDNSLVLTLSFIIYSLFIIGFGLYSTRLRKRTSDDFVLANRELGPWAASLSASASAESGWVMLGLVGEAYLFGAAAFWIIPGIALGYLFNWFFIAERLRKVSLDGSLVTLPQFIVNRFGKNSKALLLISSVIITAAMLGYVAAQMNAAGKAFDAVFSMPYWIGVLVGAGIILAYTITGGFRAICWTDIIQATFMFIALIIMPIVVLFKLGGYSNFLEGIQQVDPDLLSFTYGKAGFAMLGFIAGLIGIGLGYPGQPHVLSRFMAAKDTNTIRKAGMISISWMVIVYLGAIFFGLFAKVYFGEIADPEQALPLAIAEFLSPIIGGFVIAAIVSAICSTADSQLIVVSSIISRDIVPIFKKNSSIDDYNKTQNLDRVVLVLLALLSILFALSENRVIFTFVLYAWSVLGASFGPVVILGLLWKKTSKAGAITGMLTGAIVSVAWRNIPVLKSAVYELVPAFILAFLAVWIVSMFTSDGNKADV